MPPKGKRKPSVQLTKDKPDHEDASSDDPVPQASAAKMQQRKVVQPKKRQKTSSAAGPGVAQPVENVFAKLVKKDQWTCQECYVKNKSTSQACAACEVARPKAAAAATPAPTPEPAKNITKIAGGNVFAKAMKKNVWNCAECFVANKMEASNCAACEVPRESNKAQGKQTSTAKAPAATENVFAKLVKKDNWNCDECFVSNPNSLDKCKACEVPKGGQPAAAEPKKEEAAKEEESSGPIFEF